MNYKKIFIPIILSVAVLFLIPPPSFAALTDGLAGHWKFDNCDANDGSGNGRNGILNGNPKCIDGWNGKAYKFDGIDDYIEVSNLNLTTGSSFTISFWMNYEYKDGRIWVLYFGYNDQNLCSKSSVGGFNMLINTRYNVLQWGNPNESDAIFNSGDTQFGFFCGMDSGLQNHTNISSLSGRWSHITTTYDAGNKILKSYINGYLVNTSTGTVVPMLDNFPLYIGRSSLPYGEYNFQGVLDELSIYNRALGDTEVNDLYNTEAALNDYEIKVPNTGQGVCYNADGIIIPCPAPNNPLAQDGSYNNNPMAYRDNGDGTVTDLNTNLMWQKEDDGIGRIWYSAINYCNGLGLGGRSDWRLPTVSEMAGIVNYGKSYPDPLIDSIFLNTKADLYLTTTVSTYSPDYTYPLGVGFSDGIITAGHPYRGFYTRCVRGKQYIPLNFIDGGDGTVTDGNTGLMWQENEVNSINWVDSINYCENLRLPDNANGYTDWRLPNIKELVSLTDFLRYYSPPELVPFTMSTVNWSSTTNVSNPIDAWSSLGGRNNNIYPKWTNSYYSTAMNARCVRDESQRLLKTSWAQNRPYTYTLYDGDKDGQSDEYRVGCGAVAIGQLINYYFQKGKRAGWLENMLNGVTVYPRFCQNTIKGNRIFGGIFCEKGTMTLAGFPTELSYIDSISGVDSPGAPVLRDFLWHVAIGLDSEFVENGSTNAGGRYLWESLKKGNKMIELLRDRFGFKYNMDYYDFMTRLDLQKNFIIKSINDDKQPILMFLHLKAPNVSGFNGHWALIDGYRNPPGGPFEVQINWGWGNEKGENDLYYKTDGLFSVKHPDYQSELNVLDFQLYTNTIPINY